MGSKGFSVVVCCFNSAGKLPTTIEHLSKLEIPEDYSFELIFVDNNSTDQTAEVIRAQLSELREEISFKVVEERKAGQVFARIRGVEEAGYEYVVFCDDDNWLDRDYLLIAAEVLDRDYKIGAIGGLGILSMDSAARCRGAVPAPLKDVGSIYAVGKQSKASGFISQRGYLWGAGLVSRKSILEKVYDPNFPLVSTGRAGSVLSSGDDVELCMRVLLQGYELYYDERLVYTHALAPDKLTEEYRAKLIHGMKLFAPFKRLYFWEVLKKRNSKWKIALIGMKQFGLYIALKMRLIKKQQYNIVNPLKIRQTILHFPTESTRITNYANSL